MAISNITVLPEPVGAHTTIDLSVINRLNYKGRYLFFLNNVLYTLNT